MFYSAKHSESGQYLVDVDNDGFGVFSDNFNNSFYWNTEEDANSYVSTNSLSNITVTPASEGSNPPPGKQRPGQP